MRTTVTPALSAADECSACSVYSLDRYAPCVHIRHGMLTIFLNSTWKPKAGSSCARRSESFLNTKLSVLFNVDVLSPPTLNWSKTLCMHGLGFAFRAHINRHMFFLYQCQFVYRKWDIVFVWTHCLCIPPSIRTFPIHWFICDVLLQLWMTLMSFECFCNECLAAGLDHHLWLFMVLCSLQMIHFWLEGHSNQTLQQVEDWLMCH